MSHKKFLTKSFLSGIAALFIASSCTAQCYYDSWPFFNGQMVVLPYVDCFEEPYIRRSRIPKSYKPLIDSLNKDEKINVEVSCHTDYRGSSEYNRSLTAQRAKDLMTDLVEFHEFDKSRISFAGYGEDRPRIVPDTTCSDWDLIWGNGFTPGDTLTEKFIDSKFKRKSEQWEKAMQANRRCELKIIFGDKSNE